MAKYGFISGLFFITGLLDYPQRIISPTRAIFHLLDQKCGIQYNELLLEMQYHFPQSADFMSDCASREVLDALLLAV